VSAGASKAAGVLALIAVLAAWEVAARLALLNPLLFPPMSKIVGTFAALIASGEITGQIARSMERAALGYFLAAAVFIPLGVAMGLSQRIYCALEVVIETLRPIPPPVAIPVAMLFLGIGDGMKIFVIFFSCAWPILLNTIDGVKNIDRLLVDTARTFRLSRAKAIVRVVLPAAAPQIMTGLRISLSITLILVVISEMVGSSDGIGYFVLNAQRRLKIDQMYAGMVALALLGYILNQAFLFVCKRVLRGRPS